MGRASTRTPARRRATRVAVARSVAQMAVVIIGGLLTGGLLVVAALPGASGPVPTVVLVPAAAVATLVTVTVTRRLGRRPSGRRSR